MAAETAPANLLEVEGSGGVVWSTSPGGFHANLVALDAGGSIAAHRNDEVDVLVVVLGGDATATIDGATVPITSGSTVVVPRGATRGIAAGANGVRYLTVHAEREPLGVRRRGAPDV
jgi:quercetin dioxygenase-like cupin family protein